MAWTSPRTWTTGEVVTATMLNAHVRDNFDAVVPDDKVTMTAFTPVLRAVTADPAVSVATGHRWRVGPLVFVYARFVIADVGDGAFYANLPVAASGITSTSEAGSGQAIGSWQSRDNSTLGNSEGGTVVLATSTTVRFNRPTGVSTVAVAHNAPFLWTADDVLTFHVVYPAA